MKNFRWFLLFLLVFTAAPVHAGDLTLFGGVQRPGKLTLRSAASGTSTLLDSRSYGTYGIRVSHGRVVGSEHTLAYSPNFISSQNSAFIYNSNFIVHAPLGIVRPYATAGLGTMYIRGDSGGAFDVLRGGKFAVNYGGGVKFKLAGPVGGQIDARGYTLPSVLNETLNVLEVSVGVAFTF
ncbi:MAG: hypothetical protein A3J28_03300 [Acidobacteria bacterium RIFCSPLOWO2_12_FULL_60_22]|nr:MAG: hypothetical protein A3J28_03300 [Acidobacteria bacterium RIFCSPLOWO2_12_FULL_60_22]